MQIRVMGPIASRAAETTTYSATTAGRRLARAAADFANFWTFFWQNVARFRVYRRRSLQENTHLGFAAFFKIYQII